MQDDKTAYRMTRGAYYGAQVGHAVAIARGGDKPEECWDDNGLRIACTAPALQITAKPVKKVVA